MRLILCKTCFDLLTYFTEESHFSKYTAIDIGKLCECEEIEGQEDPLWGWEWGSAQKIWGWGGQGPPLAI